MIENRPGASGNIATGLALHAAPDGYTPLLVNAGNAINDTLFDKLNFRFPRDIEAVADIVRVLLLMEVHPSLPVKDVQDFVAYAKARPGKISYASAGTGTPQHVSAELFKMMTAVDMVHVPYSGSGPALSDLMSGQVQVASDTTAASLQYVRNGKLRALAVTTAA